MNREQLHALLTQAKAIVHHTDFVIVGSLSILGAVSDPPRTMVMSIDVDTYLKNDPQRTYELAQALGQGSVFEDEFGYYLDPVSPSLPSFPEGWQERLIPLDFGDVKAFFVQPDDVAVYKYMRGEERDLRWLPWTVARPGRRPQWQAPNRRNPPGNGPGPRPSGLRERRAAHAGRPGAIGRGPFPASGTRIAIGSGTPVIVAVPRDVRCRLQRGPTRLP